MLLGGEIALGRQGYVTCVAGFFLSVCAWRDSSGGHSETLTAFDKGQTTAFLQERLRNRKFSLQTWLKSAKQSLRASSFQRLVFYKV